MPSDTPTEKRSPDLKKVLENRGGRFIVRKNWPGFGVHSKDSSEFMGKGQTDCTGGRRESLFVWLPTLPPPLESR